MAPENPPSSPPLRVLHWPTDVGGNPTGLARAERSLGLRSDVAVIQRSAFQYDVDHDLDLGRRSKLRRLLARTKFLAESIARYDVYHFNFGQTFLPAPRGHGIDLPVLLALRKRLFMTYQGSDARPYATHQTLRPVDGEPDLPAPRATLEREDRRKRQAIEYAARWRVRSFTVNPDLVRFIPNAEFVPYASVDPRIITPPTDSAERKAGADRPITIMHAPTHRIIKGTAAVLRAFDALADLPNVRTELVEGLPHHEALQRFAVADLVVDQLRVGWYGAFAVEMMAMGVPVVAWINDDDLAHIPAAMRDELPVIRADADSLPDVLRELVRDPDRLRDLGLAARRYVERWHDPLRIARRLVEIYRDPALPFWPGTGELPPLPSTDP